VSPNKIQEKIFFGGIEPPLRKEVWKFLLGYLSFGQTEAERQQTLLDRRKDYLEVRQRWVSASELKEETDPLLLKYTEVARKILKDVPRTDQNEEFYAGENNPRVNEMREVLLSYAFYDPDLGYVQGMSDLLSPILCIMEHDADAFWCFVGLMAQVVRVAPCIAFFFFFG